MMPNCRIFFLAFFSVFQVNASCLTAVSNSNTNEQRFRKALNLSGEERKTLLLSVLEAQSRIAKIPTEQRPEFFNKTLETVKHHFTPDEFAMLTSHLAKSTSNEFNRALGLRNNYLAFLSARKKIIELDLDPILLLGVSTRLTQREIEVINMRVLDELSFAKISEAIANHDINSEGRIGVSTQQASAIYKNAIRKIERSLMNTDLK